MAALALFLKPALRQYTSLSLINWTTEHCHQQIKFQLVLQRFLHKSNHTTRHYTLVHIFAIYWLNLNIHCHTQQ